MCDGNESSLASCSHRGINITNSCTHAKDVGVNCSGSESKQQYVIALTANACLKHMHK